MAESTPLDHDEHDQKSAPYVAIGLSKITRKGRQSQQQAPGHGSTPPDRPFSDPTDPESDHQSGSSTDDAQYDVQSISELDSSLQLKSSLRLSDFKMLSDANLDPDAEQDLDDEIDPDASGSETKPDASDAEMNSGSADVEMDSVASDAELSSEAKLEQSPPYRYPPNAVVVTETGILDYTPEGSPSSSDAEPLAATYTPEQTAAGDSLYVKAFICMLSKKVEERKLHADIRALPGHKKPEMEKCYRSGYFNQLLRGLSKPLPGQHAHLLYVAATQGYFDIEEGFCGKLMPPFMDAVDVDIIHDSIFITQKHLKTAVEAREKRDAEAQAEEQARRASAAADEVKPMKIEPRASVSSIAHSSAAASSATFGRYAGSVQVQANAFDPASRILDRITDSIEGVIDATNIFGQSISRVITGGFMALVLGGFLIKHVAESLLVVVAHAGFVLHHISVHIRMNTDGSYMLDLYIKRPVKFITAPVVNYSARKVEYGARKVRAVWESLVNLYHAITPPIGTVYANATERQAARRVPRNSVRRVNEKGRITKTVKPKRRFANKEKKGWSVASQLRLTDEQ